MLEHVDPQGYAALLADQLPALQLRQRCLTVLLGLVDSRKCVELELATDDSSGLYDPSRTLVEPVQTGVDHAGEGVGNGDVFDLAGSAPMRVLPHDQRGIEQGPDHLFDEKRVPFGLSQNQRTHLLRQVLDVQQISNKLARVISVQRFKLNRRVTMGIVPRRGLVEAPRGVLPPRTKHADHHKRRLVSDRQHAFQQLEGGRIDPVQVFKYQHQRLRRRQLLEEIAGGSEHSLAQLWGLEVPDALACLVVA